MILVLILHHSHDHDRSVLGSTIVAWLICVSLWGWYYTVCRILQSGFTIHKLRVTVRRCLSTVMCSPVPCRLLCVCFLSSFGPSTSITNWWSWSFHVIVAGSHRMFSVRRPRTRWVAYLRDLTLTCEWRFWRRCCLRCTVRRVSVTLQPTWLPVLLSRTFKNFGVKCWSPGPETETIGTCSSIILHKTVEKRKLVRNQ